jgi:hypothetical protein
MKMLPKTDDAPVIRVDFDNHDAWKTICGLIRAPVREGRAEFYAYVTFVEKIEFRNLTPEQLLERVPDDYHRSFLLVVDRTATQQSEFPILVIDLFQERGRTFRAIPSQIQGIENNLSIANMGFDDFADNVDPEGVFRGFPGP